MSNTFDFGFVEVKVSITHGGHTIKGEYDLAIFKNIKTEKVSEVRCFQDNPFLDVKSDVDLIKTGNIQDTIFYKNWIRILFDTGDTFDFKKKDGNISKGYFLEQDNYKKNTFYFNIDGETVKIDGYSVIIDGDEYRL